MLEIKLSYLISYLIIINTLYIIINTVDIIINSIIHIYQYNNCHGHTFYYTVILYNHCQEHRIWVGNSDDPVGL